MDAGFAPILFLLLISMTAVRSQIEKGPSNALKKVGESVTLECVTVNKNCDQVEWQKVEGLQSPKLVYRHGQGMLNSEVYPLQRYNVISTGGCRLTIIQLEISDSGRFLCMQALVAGEETKSSILVVINVTESCMSNATSNALDKDDGYSLWCAIKVPAKSVEPSNVTLSFHNKTVGETETTDENQSLTVKTTLTGTAKEENITQRGCRASFTPNTQTNYDNSTAILDICNTTELIVSSVKSQIQKGPANALKKVGDNVTLECVTVNKNCDQVDWQKVEGLQSPKLVYRNGQGMLNNDIYPPQRYSVNSTGGCSLTITQLEINNSGRFICLLAVGEREEIRTSILVVINVTESCVSNVTSNALDKDDGYSLWCAINIPAKSVEPWNVTLSFHNKNESETETTDQPLTVKITLNGTAKKENITQLWCRASLSPNTQANYDKTTATLDICNTTELIVPHPPSTLKSSGDVDSQKVKGDAENKCTCTGYTASIVISIIAVIISVIVVVFIVWKVESCPGHVCLHSMFECGCRSDCMGDAVCCACIGGGIICCHHSKKKNDYPVANIFISVSRHGPGKGITVGLRCSADGHPPPTFKWTHLESGKVVDGNTLVIKGDVGDKYTCTTTNTVNGKETSQNITIEFTSPPPEDGHPPPTCKWTHLKSGDVVDGDTLVIMGDSGDKYTCTGTDTVKGIFASQSITNEFSPPLPPSGCKSDRIAGAVCCACIGCGIIGWFRSKKVNDYPVANIFISVSRHGPGKGITVGLRCSADGHPPPTVKWTHLESGKVVDGDTLVIKGDVGDKYTCTATNTVNGKETSQNITVEFTSPPPEGCGPGGVAGAVTGTLTGCGAIGAASYGVWHRSKDNNDENGERANDPSTDFSFGEPKRTSTNFTFGEYEKGSEKPPRRNDAPEAV